MAIELTAESTHEDITQMVDSIISDRQGEQKGDAQLIAEERDEPTTERSAESDSGSDDTASDGEKTGTKEDVDWLDDDLKAELTAYGIDEKELADFTSREEVDRALRFLDKSALDAGRKALADSDTPVRDEQGKFSKKDEPTETKDGQYEISLDKDIYDDGLVDELTRMRDHYETRVSKLESRLAEVDIQAEEQKFDGFVDALGMSDLFGKTGKENAKELQRRQDLLVATRAQKIGLQAMGRDVDLDQSLVGRVARMVFAEDISKKELKDKTRKVFQQHNSRQGGGATRPQGPVETLHEKYIRRFKELDDVG
jgi:hypothetical protein